MKEIKIEGDDTEGEYSEKLLDRELNYINKIEEMMYKEENSGPFFKDDLQNVSNYQHQLKKSEQDLTKNNEINQNQIKKTDNIYENTNDKNQHGDSIINDKENDIKIDNKLSIPNE